MTRLFLWLLTLAVLAPSLAFAEAAWDHDYTEVDALLKRHVDAEGLVDYPALAADPALSRFLQAAGALSPGEVGSWSRPQKVAFYVNVYNLITFQAVIDAGSARKMTDIQPNPWKQDRWLVAGREVSLDWIEHDQLRAHLKEPRIHFVLVCGALSCPRLLREALVPARLDAQLDAAMVEFFTTPDRNRVDVEAARVYLSRIFKWFGDDFVAGAPQGAAPKGLSGKEGAVLRWMMPHLPADQRTALSLKRFEVVYNDYDWTINRQR